MSLFPPRLPKRFPRLSPTLMIGLGLVVLVVAGLVAWQLRPKEPKEPYRFASVEQGAITRSVSASGTLEALVTVDVGSQISGLIRTVLVDFNDEVRAGQVLAVIDAQTYESRVAQGQADVAAGQASLNQSQATLAQAQADFNRKQTLVRQGIYAPSVLDTARASLRVAQAQVAAARARIGQSQAALRSQRVDLGRTTIVSPIDGVVVDRQITPGQTVAASFQAPVLFRIAQDLSKVQVKISVDEADIGQVQEGQMVRFTVDSFPDDTYEGIVTQVRKQPVTEQNVVAYVVMAEADNPQAKLLPGMTANADIILETRPNVLKVPVAALRWSPPDQTRPQARAGGMPGMAVMGPGGGGGARRQGGPGGAQVVEQLGLDAAQKKQWDAISAELRQKTQAAMAEAGGDRQKMREAMRKNMSEAFAKLEPSLKPEQKQKLVALRATMAQAGGRRGAGGGGGAGGVVYVMRDGKPAPVPVQTGATDGSFTQVRSRDLKPGDQVIVGGGPRPKATAGAAFGPPGGGGRGPGGGGISVRM